MRKALAIVMATLTLAACAVPDQGETDEETDRKNYARVVDFEVVKEGFNDILNIDEIPGYVRNNVTYEEDPGDYWQSPRETLDRRAGDCEDRAILYINILYARFGIKAELVLLDTRGRKIEEGGSFTHAAARFPDGKIIATSQGYEYDLPVKFSYSFDEIFNHEGEL